MIRFRIFIFQLRTFSGLVVCVGLKNTSATYLLLLLRRHDSWPSLNRLSLIFLNLRFDLKLPSAVNLSTAILTSSVSLLASYDQFVVAFTFSSVLKNLLDQSVFVRCYQISVRFQAFVSSLYFRIHTTEVCCQKTDDEVCYVKSEIKKSVNKLYKRKKIIFFLSFFYISF